MKIIIGLGNPGEKYKNTRHNAGFMAVDFILRGNEFILEKPGKEFSSETHVLEKNGEKLVFLKPHTYMNDSGQAAKAVRDFYKLDAAKDLLVIHDDVDLPLGSIRTTNSSSAAGHNGIKDIIEKLGTQDFARVRVGVEARPSRADLPTDAFVLQNFTEEEIKKLKEEVLPKVKLEVEKFLGLDNLIT